jgi:type IV fimbrial biogenesis protein FimT
MKKYLAFTLLELLITVAIVSILALVAFPSLTSYSQDGAMVANANALLGSLKLARSEAITRGKRVSVCPSSNALSATTPSCEASDWKVGWVTWVDDNSDNKIDSSEKIIRVVGKAKGADISIQNGCAANSVISYFSTGLPQVTFADGAVDNKTVFALLDARGEVPEARIIRVYASGRIKVSVFEWACR